MKTNAIRVSQVGGPEVLEWTQVEVPAPGPNEVQLRHHAIGLNFVEVYHRTGFYPRPLPFVPGEEAVGEVIALGAGVTSLRIGQRVAYVGLGGAYSEVRNAPVDRLVPLPDGLEDLKAASIMLKGMTAEFLLRRCHAIVPGETIVFHAAAGGVGQLAVPWARHLGARVIAVVGREEKVALAKAAGAHHVLVQSPDLAQQVKDLTEGKGASVVYDSVGKDTWRASLDSLKPRGLLVSFGQASGAVPPVELTSLGGPRSLFLTRPSLFAYIATRDELLASSTALFDVVRSGVVKVPAPKTFALREVADAHRALESRATTGAIVLLP